MVLEDVLIWHGVVSRIADGGVGYNVGGLVPWIIVLACELECHAGGIPFPGVLVTVAVVVRIQPPIVVDLEGEFIA